jgi:hypothetical protein
VRILLLSILLVSSAAAEISLPLEGYYRPGAYMPVASGGERGAMLRAPGGVATQAGATPGVLPVLVLSATADHLERGDQKVPLHALAADQRLVGCATRDDALLPLLFPSNPIVTIQLNPENPLPGSPLAWDSLDVLVTDAIDAKLIAPLLATGMTIAVRSDAPPDKLWPWKRLGDAWVLRPPADQPLTIDESAYEPTYAWQPAHSAATRQLVFIVAVLASCAMLGIALWRSRWSLPALVLFAGLFCAGISVWRVKHTDVMTMTREGRTTGQITCTDRWTFQMSPTATKAEMKFDGITWPVFASAAHAESVHCVLECDATGNPSRFVYDLPSNARMAFVTREILKDNREGAKSAKEDAKKN